MSFVFLVYRRVDGVLHHVDVVAGKGDLPRRRHPRGRRHRRVGERGHGEDVARQDRRARRREEHAFRARLMTQPVAPHDHPTLYF